jgi:hypothetical protein
LSTQITATFQVTDWQEEPFDERPDAPKLTSARVARSYSGDIAGDSLTEWLMAYAEDGSASFVGLERISATIAGRAGTIVVQHVGTFRDGTASAGLTVLVGCGTAGLAGVSGSGVFVADPGGWVRLELSLP